MLKVSQDLSLDHIYILGDYADFYSVSSHSKDPRVFAMLQDEVVGVLSCIQQLDDLFPQAKKYFIQGNHEWRLERYLMQQAPALFGVTDTEHLLELAGRPNWKFIPYGPNQSISVAGSFLKARHEPLASSAKATATRALCSLVYGHIHRIEESHMVGLDGTNHVCFSVGWLGDKRKDQIFDYVKGHHQWQMGFGLVWVNPKTRFFYHQKIHILEHNGKVSCVVNGKEYSL
jgi:UDP-2,3-diacylglucosamine pyrophosphatase LpxH